MTAQFLPTSDSQIRKTVRGRYLMAAPYRAYIRSAHGPRPQSEWHSFTFTCDLQGLDI